MCYSKDTEGFHIFPSSPALNPATTSSGVLSDISTSTEKPRERPFWDYDELLERIAVCESGGYQFYPEGHPKEGQLVVSHTNDVGKYQINVHYHLERSQQLGLDIYTEIGNTEYAYLLFAEQGSNPWSASESCWKDSEYVTDL